MFAVRLGLLFAKIGCRGLKDEDEDEEEDEIRDEFERLKSWTRWESSMEGALIIPAPASLLIESNLKHERLGNSGTPLFPPNKTKIKIEISTRHWIFKQNDVVEHGIAPST